MEVFCDCQQCFFDFLNNVYDLLVDFFFSSQDHKINKKKLFENFLQLIDVYNSPICKKDSKVTHSNEWVIRGYLLNLVVFSRYDLLFRFVKYVDIVDFFSTTKVDYCFGCSYMIYLLNNIDDVDFLNHLVCCSREYKNQSSFKRGGKKLRQRCFSKNIIWYYYNMESNFKCHLKRDGYRYLP